ncbi:melanocortin receptor 3-like [Saccostrea cucullata]|uniref:melanocortin receptor 3-like n=1 Tax=Saccostrea cuccullata TaxID=36930 RepID=UPI002ED63D17
MDNTDTTEKLFSSSKVHNRSLFMFGNNLTDNVGEEEEEIFQHTFEIFVSTTIMLIVGAFGNCFTIIFIAVKGKLHTPTFTVIACLGIADLLASCSRFISALNIYFPIFNYKEITIYHIFTLFFLHAANWHIVLLAYVRCALISSPFESLGITCGKVIKISAVLWAFSGVATCAYGTVKIMEIKGIIKYQHTLITEITFASYIYLLPLFFVVFFHFKKIIAIKRHQSVTRTQRYTHMSRSMSIMFIIIIAIFIISFTPFYVYIVIVYVCTENNWELYVCTSYTFVLSYIIASLCIMFNNCINPIVYFMFSPPARQFLLYCRKYC